MSEVERASEEREQMEGGTSERANGQASDPVLMSRFLVVPVRSVLEET